MTDDDCPALDKLLALLEVDLSVPPEVARPTVWEALHEHVRFIKSDPYGSQRAGMRERAREAAQVVLGSLIPGAVGQAFTNEVADRILGAALQRELR